MANVTIDFFLALQQWVRGKKGRHCRIIFDGYEEVTETVWIYDYDEKCGKYISSIEELTERIIK